MPTIKGIARLTWTEIRSDWVWHAGWILLVFVYLLVAVLLYPGEEALREMLGLFQTEDLFKAFLGDIGGRSPSYTLWVSLLFSFMSALFFLYGVMTGSRLVLRSMDTGVGEILHVMPLSRTMLHGVRLLESVIMSTSLFLMIGITLVIPWTGEMVPPDRVVLFAGWGIAYMVMAMNVGMVLGLASGTTGKGIQLGLLFTVLLFAMQSLARVQPTEFEALHEWNLLTWFDTNGILLEREMPQESALKILAVLFLVMILSTWSFRRRDLIRDPPIPLVNRIRIDLGIFKNLTVFGKNFRSEKRSIFTFWARVLERRFPFAADFIYSERMVLFISFWAVVLIWPFQLVFYPRDERALMATIAAFGETPFMRLFTYGHDLVSEPYLWYLVTQTIGIHWIFFVPLVLHWVGKIVRHDTNVHAGEIMGSLPVSNRQVILERVLAANIEMLVILFQMIAWLVISEHVFTGKTEGTTWEIIAVIAVFPLYFLLLNASVSLALLLEERGLGVKLSRAIIIILLLAFIIGKMLETLDQWYVTLLFGLYDPVLIIQEQSLLVKNGSVIIYTVLSIISVIVVYWMSSSYRWMYVEEWSVMPQDRMIHDSSENGG